MKLRRDDANPSPTLNTDIIGSFVSPEDANKVISFMSHCPAYDKEECISRSTPPTKISKRNSDYLPQKPSAHD